MKFYSCLLMVLMIFSLVVFAACGKDKTDKGESQKTDAVTTAKSVDGTQNATKADESTEPYLYDESDIYIETPADIDSIPDPETGADVITEADLGAPDVNPYEPEVEGPLPEEEIPTPETVPQTTKTPEATKKPAVAETTIVWPTLFREEIELPDDEFD